MDAHVAAVRNRAPRRRNTARAERLENTNAVSKLGAFLIGDRSFYLKLLWEDESWLILSRVGAMELSTEARSARPYLLSPRCFG